LGEILRPLKACFSNYPETRNRAASARWLVGPWPEQLQRLRGSPLPDFFFLDYRRIMSRYVFRFHVLFYA
jgi:hypothetical protein